MIILPAQMESKETGCLPRNKYQAGPKQLLTERQKTLLNISEAILMCSQFENYWMQIMFLKR